MVDMKAICSSVYNLDSYSIVERVDNLVKYPAPLVSGKDSNTAK